MQPRIGERGVLVQHLRIGPRSSTESGYRTVLEWGAQRIVLLHGDDQYNTQITRSYFQRYEGDVALACAS